jgi:hypothetical protein
MSFLRRVNVFWLGAGGFLTLFCADELISFFQSRVRMWLGGPALAVADVVGILVGLSILRFLAVEDAPVPRDLGLYYGDVAGGPILRLGGGAKAGGAARAGGEDDAALARRRGGPVAGLVGCGAGGARGVCCAPGRGAAGARLRGAGGP